MLEQLGRYRITGRLGAGGMGVVYLAEDTMLARRVALKTLRLESADPGSHQELAERFVREARIVAQMEHPGIVSVYDFGYEGNTAYLVLEYVAGSSLAQRLDHQQPRLDAAACVRMLREAASALDYAHKRGVVHRDVKPANLLMTEDGRVKVADFGIAKLSGSTTMTATGMLMGTVEYMSPEQIRGESVDGRSDQFSLAVVAYQMVTGQRPFQADSAVTVAHMIVYEQPTPPSAVNRTTLNLDKVLTRALHKQPAMRYATCTEFAQDLEQAWLGASTPIPSTAAPSVSPGSAETAPMQMQAPPASPTSPVPSIPPPQPAPPPMPVTAPRAPSKRWIWVGVAAGFLLLCGVAVFAALRLAPVVLAKLYPASNPPVASSQPAPIPPQPAAQSIPPPPASLPAQPETTPSQPLTTQTRPSALPGRRHASVEEEKAEHDEAANASAKPSGNQIPAVTLEKKAAGGDVRTMVQTGDAFASGRGATQDYAKAKQWYEQAAAKGNGGAMTRLGDLYLKGLGVPRDYVIARNWYEQAAAKDFREAMDRLGELYYQGLGVPRDYGAAKTWYEKAAQRGFPLSFIHLARLYRYGNGVAQDCDIARNWYEEAAAAHDNTAMLMLGDLYSKGCVGFRDDREKAREWYQKAAQAGNELAGERLDTLK